MSDDDGAGQQIGDTTMFAIFAFSLLVLGGIPVTWWRISSGAGADQDIVQPWLPKDAKKPSLAQKVKKYANTCNVVLLVMWLLVLALGLFITTAVSSAQPFDPFKILQIPETATEQDIRKAYRDMSKKYHPDKNPDPEAHKFFAEFITKAYQTLTDEASRENWIKHGHPDGPQAMSVGVALPEWFFTSNKRLAPLVLFGLVFVGLAVPILIIACYLWRADQYVGTNKIMEQTLYMYHRFCVKEALRVTKMAESIIYANELATMPFRKESLPAMQRFVQAMRRDYPGLNEKKAVWGLQPALVRAYLMLVAHLDRNSGVVPPELTRELRDVLRITPILCEEFVKASCSPRNKYYQGWLMPAQAAIEFSQCLVHAIKPEVRNPKAVEAGGKKKGPGGQAVAELLQLPGVEEEEIKNLERKHKIKSLPELTALPQDQRDAVLSQLGLSTAAVGDVNKMLLSLPHVHVTELKVYVDGESDVKEGDLVTVEAVLALRRASHSMGLAVERNGAKSSVVQAYAPRFPHPVHEKWWVFLADVPKNLIWASTHIDLIEGEAAGAANAGTLPCKWDSEAAAAAGAADAPHLIQGAAAASAAAGNGVDRQDGKDDAAAPAPVGQKVDLKFMATEPGKHELSLLVMSSCWLGCDAAATATVKIEALTGAERDGRGAVRGKGAKAIPLDEDEMEEADKKKLAKKAEGAETEEADDDGDDDDDEDDDEDGDDEGWDTDETGSSVTHADLDPEEAAERASESKKSK